MSAARLALAATFAALAAPVAAEGLFVYVSPDPIGVNPFLQMGQAGTEAAAAQHGAEVRTFESSTATARAENVAAAIDEGATLVVLLGFEFADIVNRLAPTAPDVDFLIVDQCIEDQPANVHCAVFREYEASYLMGVAAAALSETGTVGVIGALDIPFMHRFTDGFAEGARGTNPDIEVETRWVGGDAPFADPVRAKEQALALTGAGADVLFAAAAAGNFGIFEAAEEQGVQVLGVDIANCDAAPGRMIDSALKRVDTAITSAVDAIMAGEDAVFMSLGLAEGGVSAVALEAEDPSGGACTIAQAPEIAQAMRDVAARIASGELALEDPMFAQ